MAEWNFCKLTCKLFKIQLLKTKILSFLHRLPIIYHIQFKILLLTFRALHGQSSQYIVDLQPYPANQALRSRNKKICCLSLDPLLNKRQLCLSDLCTKTLESSTFPLRFLDFCDVCFEAVINIPIQTGIWFIKAVNICIMLVMALCLQIDRGSFVCQQLSY